MKSRFLELISKLTVHGITKLAASKSWKFKLVWLLIITTAIGYCSYNLFGVIVDFWSFSFILNIDTIREDNSQIPAITYCNFRNSECYLGSSSCPYTHIRKLNENCSVFNSGINEKGEKLPILDFKEYGYSGSVNLFLVNSSDKNVEIYIHNQSVSYESVTPFRVLNTGETSLVISRKFRQRLASPYSDCRSIFTYASTPVKTMPYFQSECYLLCKKQKLMEICNQTDFYSQNWEYYFSNISYSNEMFKKELKACKQVNASIIDDFNKEWNDLGENMFCKDICPIECESVTYKVEPFLMKMGSSYAKVNIYYKNFEYELTTEIAKTNLFSFIGSLGGLLGVFLGFSVISLFEVIEAMVLVFCQSFLVLFGRFKVFKFFECC